MITAEALLEQFEKWGISVKSKEILDKCVEYCIELNSNEEAFVESWIAFSATNDDLNPTVKRIEEMFRHEKSTKSKKMEVDIKNVSIIDNQEIFEDDDILQLYGYKQEDKSRTKKPRTPENESSSIQDLKKQVTDVTQSPNVATQKNTPKVYKDSGKVLLAFGKKLQNWKTGTKKNSDVKRSEQNHIKSDATYGFELLSDKVKCLQSLNRTLGHELCTAWHNSDNADISYTSHTNMKSQKQIRTWGRIRCEKLQPGKTTIYLEGCTRLTEQKDVALDRLENYVELDLSQISSYSLYPGQIVAVQATNPTGNTLVVSKIFKGHLLKEAPKDSLVDTLKMIVVSGPLTTLDNLNFDPLWDLMNRVIEEEPNILILGGPFIECTHPELKEYRLSTFQDLFEATVAKIMDKLDGKNTQVLIVSSHRDIHHDPVYPTPEYSLSKNYKNLHLMPDPCTICINGLKISITTVDSIMHLGRKEVVLKPANADKLGRLANYVLSQGFFYPLYPPAKEITLDTVLWQRHAYMETSPHLLILPSDMRHFCKPINSTVVINPERLNKRIYARVEVRPSQSNAWSHEQVSCEIVKL